ncbi:hypothetical protein [Abyssisolibacter fermentans]|uniref:hypothetical protein n=1 Tax=Abyssisolibacter fermentans TaxID=1766203 RepID=UPI0008379FEC|nr:hypothetical protein [Abyssisolibacter fermentans]
MKNIAFRILFMIVILTLLPLNALHAQSSISLDAEVGFNGLYRYEEITPVKINIHAYSGLKGRIQVSFYKEFEPTYNRSNNKVYERFNKEIEMNEDSISANINVAIPKECNYLYITLIDEDNNELAKNTISINAAIKNNQKVIALFSNDDESYKYIDNIKVDDLANSYFKVVNFIGTKIDDRRILDNFDYMIFNEEILKNMNGETAILVKQWIQKGGVALLENNLDKNLVNILFNEIRFTADKKIYNLSKGKIILLDRDIINTENTSYITSVLRTNMNYARNVISKNYLSQMNLLLRHIPKRKLPSLRKVMLILLIYMIIVGPVNYFTLKLYDKKEKIWLTSPIIAIVITLSIFLTSRGSVFDKAIFNSVTFADFTTFPQKLYIQNEIGLTGISGENVKIGVEKDVDFRLTNRIKQSNIFDEERYGINYYLDEEKKLTLSNSSTWDVNYVSTEEIKDLENPIVTDISINDTVISGSITNTADIMLEDCMLIIGNIQISLGDIEPNQSIDINENIDNNQSKNRINTGYSYQERKEDVLNYNVKEMILAEYNKTLLYKPFENIKIIAWNRNKISGDLKIDKKFERIDRNMLILPVNIKMKSGNKVNVPNGILKPKLVEITSLNSNSVASLNSDYYSQYMYGTGVCIYEISPIKDLEVKMIDIKSKTENSKYDVYLYNYKTEKWVKFTDKSIVLKDRLINYYYNESNGVKLKMHSKANTNFLIPEYGIKGVVK